MTAITVAIVNYNTTDLLGGCLGALRAAVQLPHEVVVVDNASADGGAGRIGQEHPHVTVIGNPVNRFYPPAANQAWRAGRGETVLFLGTDVLVQPGTVEAMHAVLARNHEYGAVGCRLVSPEGEAEPGARRELTPAVYLYSSTPAGRLLPARRDAVSARQDYADWDRRSDRDVDSCAGSCLMVRRDVLERFGGYDERYRLYFLEDDLCAKIRRAGLKIRFLGTCQNIHIGHASVRRETAAVIREIWRRDAQSYAWRHFNIATAAMIAGAMGITGALRKVQERLARAGLAPEPVQWWRRETDVRQEPGERS